MGELFLEPPIIHGDRGPDHPAYDEFYDWP